MRTTTTVLLLVLRIGGLIQVGLGLLFWINIAQSLVPVHILMGLALVLVLWILSAIGAFARVNRRRQPRLSSHSRPGGAARPDR